MSSAALHSVSFISLCLLICLLTKNAHAWSGYQEDLTNSSPAETSTAIMTDPNNIRFKTQFGETYVIDEPNMVIWKDLGLLVRPAAYRKVLVERDIASIYTTADDALKTSLSNMIRAVNDFGSVNTTPAPSATPRPTRSTRKRSRWVHFGSRVSSLYPLDRNISSFAKVGNWTANYWLTDGQGVIDYVEVDILCLDRPPFAPTNVTGVSQDVGLAYLPVGGLGSNIRDWFGLAITGVYQPTAYCNDVGMSHDDLTLLAISLPQMHSGLVYVRARLKTPIYALTTQRGGNDFLIAGKPIKDCGNCCWGYDTDIIAHGDCAMASQFAPDVCADEINKPCTGHPRGSYLLQKLLVPPFKYPSTKDHVLLKKFVNTFSQGQPTTRQLRSFLCSIPLISSVINSCGTADMSQLKAAVKTNTMQIVKNGNEIAHLYKDVGGLASGVKTLRSEVFNDAQESAAVNKAQDLELDHLFSGGLETEHAIILATSALIAMKTYSDASTLFTEEFARSILAQQLVKGRPGGQLTSASALTGIIPTTLSDAGLVFSEGELDSFTEMSLWEKTTTITDVQIDPDQYKLQFELSVPLFDDSTVYRLQKPLPMCYTKDDFSFCGQTEIYRLESYNQNLHRYDIQYIEPPVCTITTSSYLCPPGSLRKSIKPTVEKMDKPVPAYLNIDNKMVLVQDPSQITVTHQQNDQTKQIGTVPSTLYLLGCNSTLTIKEGSDTSIIASDNSGSNCPATTRSIKMGANIVKAITTDEKEFNDVAAEVDDKLSEQENKFHDRIASITSTITANQNKNTVLDKSLDDRIKGLLNDTKEGVLRVGNSTRSFAAEQAVNEDWKDALHNSTVSTIVVILYGCLILILICCVAYLMKKDTGGRVGKVWHTRMPQTGYRNYGYNPNHAGQALGVGTAAAMPMTSFAMGFYETEEWQYFTVGVTFLSFIVAMFSLYTFFKRFHPVVSNRKVRPQIKYVCNWYIDICVDNPENKKCEAKFVHLCTTNHTPDVVGLVCAGKGLVLHCFYGNEHSWIHLPKDSSINAEFRPLYCQLHQSDKTKPSSWIRKGAIIFREHESIHSKSIAESCLQQLRKTQRTYNPAMQEISSWVRMGMPDKDSVLATFKENPVRAPLVIKSINEIHEQMIAYLKSLSNLSPEDEQLNTWKTVAYDTVKEYSKDLAEIVAANALSLRDLMGPQSAFLMVASHFGYGDFSQGSISTPFSFFSAVLPGMLSPNIRLYMFILAAIVGADAKMDDIAIASSFTLTHLFILFSYSTRMTCSVYLSSLCASLIPTLMLAIEIILTLYFPQIMDADWPYDSVLRFVRTLMFTVMMWWVYRRSEHMKNKKTLVAATTPDGTTIAETRSAGRKHQVATWIWVASFFMYFLTHIPNLLIITSSNTKQCIIQHALSFDLPTCGHNGTTFNLI